MKHEKEISKCRLRAEACLAQADFIENRCKGIDLVCVHSPYEDSVTGGMIAAIHLYSKREAMAAFGAEGWVPEPKSPRAVKLVDGFTISYDINSERQ